jgi:hypothetical protein
VRRRSLIALLAVAAAAAAAGGVWLMTGGDDDRRDGWEVNAHVGPHGARVRHAGWSVRVLAGASGRLTMRSPDPRRRRRLTMRAAPSGMGAAAPGIAAELTGGRLGRRGAIVTQRLARPLPDGAQGSLAYFDPRRGRWRPVATRISRDRTTLTAAVHHLSWWEAVQYGAGWLLDKRVSPPDCRDGLPRWMQPDGVTFLDDRNGPVRWCAGTDPADEARLQVKVAVNRSYGVAVEPTMPPAHVQAPIAETPGDALNGAVARALHWSSTRVPAMGGQQAELSFTEAQVRAAGTRALVHVELDARDAVAGLAFLLLSDDLVKDGRVGSYAAYAASYAAIAECETQVLSPFARGDWSDALAGLADCVTGQPETVAQLTARALADAFPREDPRTLGSIAGKAGKLLKWIEFAGYAYKSATWLADRHLIDAAFDLHAFPRPIRSTDAGPRTWLSSGYGELRYKPTELKYGGSGIACGVFSARDLEWKTWTSSSATADGTLVYNPGEPTCAEAKLQTTFAHFRFFRPEGNCLIYDPDTERSARNPRTIFTRVDIVVPGWRPPEEENPWHTAPPDGFQCRRQG